MTVRASLGHLCEAGADQRPVRAGRMVEDVDRRIVAVLDEVLIRLLVVQRKLLQQVDRAAVLPTDDGRTDDRSDADQGLAEQMPDEPELGKSSIGQLIAPLRVTEAKLKPSTETSKPAEICASK